MKEAEIWEKNLKERIWQGYHSVHITEEEKEMELVAGSTYGNVMAHEMAHLQK